jgi:hypothetical protein
MPTESVTCSRCWQWFSVITYVADHPARLAHVDLVLPVGVVGELVLRQAPARKSARGSSPARAGGRPGSTSGPAGRVRWRATIFGALVVTRPPDSVVLADEVGAEGELVVGVGLAVGHGRIDPGQARSRRPRSCAAAARTTVRRSRRAWRRAAVVRHGRSGTCGSSRPARACRRRLPRPVRRIDAGQQPAPRAAGHHVGIDGFHKLMVPCVRGLHAVERLAVHEFASRPTV